MLIRYARGMGHDFLDVVDFCTEEEGSDDEEEDVQASEAPSVPSGCVPAGHALRLAESDDDESLTHKIKRARTDADKQSSVKITPYP